MSENPEIIKKVPLHVHAMRPENAARWAKDNLGLGLPDTMDTKTMCTAMKAKIANVQHQNTVAAASQAEAQAAAAPPQTAPPSDGQPQTALPPEMEAAPPADDGEAPAAESASVSEPATPQVAAPGEAAYVGLRKNTHVEGPFVVDSDPVLSEQDANILLNPALKSLMAQRDDGSIDPAMAAMISQVPAHMLAPPKKPFRHPPCTWLYNPNTRVYFKPTELLMHNQEFTAVMGDPPPGSVFGTL